MYMYTMHLYMYQKSYTLLQAHNYYFNRGTILQCYTNNVLYDFVYIFFSL